MVQCSKDPLLQRYWQPRSGSLNNFAVLEGTLLRKCYQCIVTSLCRGAMSALELPARDQAPSVTVS